MGIVAMVVVGECALRARKCMILVRDGKVRRDVGGVLDDKERRGVG